MSGSDYERAMEEDLFGDLEDVGKSVPCLAMDASSASLGEDTDNECDYWNLARRDATKTSVSAPSLPIAMRRLPVAA